MLLDVGVSSHELTHLLRWAYVRQAAARLKTPNRRASASRLAAVTGLTRADVRQLLTELPVNPKSTRWAPRASETILAGWATDPDFLDSNGKPRPLPYSDGGTGFFELARRYARDIPPRAMLNELLDSSLVVDADGGGNRFVPSLPRPPVSETQRDALAGFGTKMGFLGATILRNLRNPDVKPMFETLSVTRRPTGQIRARVIRDLERRCRTFSQGIERYLLDQISTSSSDPADEQIDGHVGVIVAVVDADAGRIREEPGPEKFNGT
jgi:hypothetical protein